MKELWKVDNALRVKFFRNFEKANDYAAKFKSAKISGANESEICWYETKHKNCEHLKCITF